MQQVKTEVGQKDSVFLVPYIVTRTCILFLTAIIKTGIIFKCFSGKTPKTS